MSEIMDNEGLEPLGIGVECPEYVPTRHELLELARYWYEKRLSTYADCFYYEITDSYESRMLSYAERRLGRIAAAIGRAAMDAIVVEVEVEYQQRMGGDWEVVADGSPEQRETVRERVENENGIANNNDSIHQPARCPDLPGQMWLWEE